MRDIEVNLIQLICVKFPHHPISKKVKHKKPFNLAHESTQITILARQ
jgi:hypothetical protein